MILQALNNYYIRKQAELAPEGLEIKEIPFLLVIDEHGNFVDLQDTRTFLGKRPVGRKFLVPKEEGRSGKNAWQQANLLWDHYGYVLAWPKLENSIDKDMAERQHRSFVERLKTLTDYCPEDNDVKAVYLFLQNRQFGQIYSHPMWSDCKRIPGCNMTFRINGKGKIVCENDSVRAYIAGSISNITGNDNLEPIRQGLCLISGDRQVIARLHPRTPIPGAKSNAKIVSFQKNMGFDSYGKEQSYNAPISQGAAFAYTTALNHMLAKGSKQKLSIGDSTVIFWAEKAHPIEDIFADIFGEPAKDNPVQDAKAIVAMFRAPEIGSRPELDPTTKFFVLGLQPNSARIAVRFWYDGTVQEVVDNIYQHFEDCSIIHGPGRPETLSLFRLLVSTAIRDKPENIQSSMGGEFMRAILAGTPYPRSLLTAVIMRLKAEHEVTYARAALIKAILSRESRYYKNNETEVGMALDKDNNNIGYRLGRLFSVLEKIQEEANPGINATIRDRLYGAASSTPVTAFPQLMKLKNHHLTKLGNRGRAINFERVMAEIIDRIDEFPNYLSLADQGRFAVGYYHQRLNFFTKKDE